MKKIFIILLLMTTSAHAEFLGFGKKEPIDLNDVKAVVESLRPVSRGDSWDVSFTVYTNNLTLSIRLPNGQTIYGRGYDLKATLVDLSANLNKSTIETSSAKDAVQAILNQGKASQ